MASMSIEIENLKCGGCARTITRELSAMEGVGAVKVDVDQGVVELQVEERLLPEVVSRLAALGYPKRGTLQGIASGVAAAKSYVSCAIGKVSR